MKQIIFLVALLSSSLSFAGSPFTDISFDSAPSVEVQVAGETYFLLNVNGVRRAEIVDRCNATFGTECECMLAEKFSETMSAIGVEVGETVSLGLYKMAGHQVLNIDGVAVTLENSEEIYINRSLRGEACY